MFFCFQKKLKIFVSFGLFFSTQAVATQDDSGPEGLSPLTVYTLELPPVVFKTKEGKASGFATEIVETFLNSKNVNYNIIVTQWKAAYLRATTRPNSLIYPLAWSKTREDSFHWLKLLDTDQYFLFSSKNQKLGELTKKEILAGDYTISCVSLSIQCDFVREFGFPENRIISSFDMGTAKRFDLLMRKRVDFTVFNMQILTELASKEGLDVNKIIQSFWIGDVNAYLAVSKNMDPRILAILQKNNK